MAKFNKTLNVTVIEQVKSGLIITLVVGIVAFMSGVYFQRSNTVAVKNTVVVSQTSVKK